jgi:hypothetical protein
VCLLLQLGKKADFEEQAQRLTELLNGLQLSLQDDTLPEEGFWNVGFGAPTGNPQAQKEAGEEQQQKGSCPLSKGQRQAAAHKPKSEQPNEVSMRPAKQAKEDAEAWSHQRPARQIPPGKPFHMHLHLPRLRKPVLLWPKICYEAWPFFIFIGFQLFFEGDTGLYDIQDR